MRSSVRQAKGVSALIIIIKAAARAVVVGRPRHQTNRWHSLIIIRTCNVTYFVYKRYKNKLLFGQMTYPQIYEKCLDFLHSVGCPDFRRFHALVVRIRTVLCIQTSSVMLFAQLRRFHAQRASFSADDKHERSKQVVILVLNERPILCCIQTSSIAWIAH